MNPRAMLLAPLLALLGCGATATTRPPGAPKPTEPAPVIAALSLPSEDVRLAAIGAPPSVAPAEAPLAEDAPDLAPTRLRLTLDAKEIAIPAGRSLVAIEANGGELVSVAVFGPTDALLGFDLLGRTRRGSLDEDGRLPRVVSVIAPGDGPTELLALVDVDADVRIARVSAKRALPPVPTARDLKLGKASPRTLIGLPLPSSRDDGYLLQSPGRYLFARVDVAAQLLAALKQTRVRFKRDPIAIADVSQWDGIRPATDLGHPRHISHEGGRDVDLALPADDGDPSTVRVHCNGVLVEQDVYGCAPGTARGVDSLRLAYLLGLLVDAKDPPVEKIFLDEQYVKDLYKAVKVLHERKWIKDDGLAALSEEGIVHASNWHTDHVHVRFVGESGKSPF